MKKTQQVVVILLACLVVLCLFHEAFNAREDTAALARTVGAEKKDSEGSGSPLNGGAEAKGVPDSLHLIDREVEQQSAFALISATPGETRVRFCLGKWSMEEEVLPTGERVSWIKSSAPGTLVQKGAPALPVYRCDFAVPRGAYTIEERHVRCREVKCLPPVASAGMLLASDVGDTPPFEELNEEYLAAVWPKERKTELEAYSLRGVMGQGMAYCPFQYDGTRGVMLVTEEAEIVLRAEGARAEDYSALSSEPGFAQLQSRSLCNSALLREAEGDRFARILLVVPDGWKEVTADFCRWKRDLGNRVEVVEYPGETSDDLSAYFRTAYVAGTTHIILCGDSESIPPAYTAVNVDAPGTSEPTSDIGYVLVDGEDFFADMFISRLPANDKAQLEGMMSKLVAYESNGENKSWRAMSLSVASSQSCSIYPYQGRTDAQLIRSFRKKLIDHLGYSEDGVELYAMSSPTAEQVSSALNAGASLMMYLGHGYVNYLDTTKFSSNDAKKLKNGMNLPFCLLPVCTSGNFAHTKKDCLAESFFKTASVEQDGAIAVLASTNDTYWTPPIRDIEVIVDNMQEAYGGNALCDFGAYSWAGIQAGAALADAEESQGRMKTGMYHVRQMHLFGDCSALARIVPMVEASIESHVEGEQLTLSVQNNGRGVSGVYVTLTQKETVIYGRTGADGCVSVDLTVFDEAGELDVFVRGAAITDYHHVLLLYRGQYFVLAGKSDLGKQCAGLELNEKLQLSSGELIESHTELPVGLDLGDEGVLSGVPAVAGNYVIDCKTNKERVYRIQLSVLANPDTDGDGALEHQELLAFLNELNDETSPCFARVIEWWKNGELLTRGKAKEAMTPGIAEAIERQWQVKIRNLGVRSQYEDLEKLGGDICFGNAEYLSIYAGDDCLAALKEKYDVLSVEPIREEMLRGNSVYPTYNEIMSQMKEWCREGGERVRISYIGTSPNGCEISALRITDLDDEAAEGAPQLLIAGGIHGNERPSVVCALAMAEALCQGHDLLKKAVFWVVPCMNPDGYGKSRYNSNSKDLNRDYPDGVVIRDLGMFGAADAMRLAGRQSETADFMRWCALHNFCAVLHLHTGDQLVCYPYGNYVLDKAQAISPDDELLKRLAHAYADASGYITKVENAAEYYTVIGECADWQYRYLGILPLTVELTGSEGIGKEPNEPEKLRDLAQKNVNAMLSWAKVACTGVAVQVSCSKEKLPNVSLKVNDSMPMYSTSGGKIFRTSLPGERRISLSAQGYVSKNNIYVCVEDGEIGTLSGKKLTAQEGTCANMLFSKRYALPLRENEVKISANEQQIGKYVIMTIGLPDNAVASLGESKGKREEEDGKASYVLSAAEEYAVQLSIGEDLNVEPAISVTLTTENATHTMKANWPPAPRKDRDIQLRGGWNLLGFAEAPDMAQVLESLQLWTYDNGTFALAKTIEPGKAYFVYAEEPAKLTVRAWRPEYSLQKEPGWFLGAMPYDKKVKGVYSLKNRNYVRSASILEHEGFWKFAEGNN